MFGKVDIYKISQVNPKQKKPLWLIGLLDTSKGPSDYLKADLDNENP